MFCRAPGFFKSSLFLLCDLRWAGFGSRLSYDDILSSLLLLCWVCNGCDEILSYPLLFAWIVMDQVWVKSCDENSELFHFFFH